MSEQARECGKCGNPYLVYKRVSPGHVRKECDSCGSTGPFVPRKIEARQ